MDTRAIWALIAERENTATATAQALREQIAAFTTAPTGMRAKDLCLAPGLGTTPKDTEGLRAKLKRLVTRQILIESEPGLFTLAPTTPSTQDHEQDR